MSSPAPNSLTGTAAGAPLTHHRSVCLALGRLRLGVVVGCWVVCLALVVQMVVWASLAFTDVRWEEHTAAAPAAPLVVQGGVAEPLETPSVLDTNVETAERTPVNPNMGVSRLDGVLRVLSGLAHSAGPIVLLMVLPMIVLGVLLGASSATPGIERSISSFNWCVIVLLLITPVGQMLGLPWGEGALWSYDVVTQRIDEGPPLELTSLTGGKAMATSVGRYIALPLACIVAVILCASRFCSGIRMGVLQKERLQLDRALEQEAANIKAGSHHGGRAGAAMSRVIDPPPARPDEKPAVASVRQIPAGDRPRRLI